MPAAPMWPTARQRVLVVTNRRIDDDPVWGGVLAALRRRGARVVVALPYQALALLRAPTPASADGTGLVLSTPGLAQVVGELVASRTGATHVAISNGAPRRSLVERVITRAVAPRLDSVVALDRVHVPRLVESGYPPTRIRTVPPDVSSADFAGRDPRVASPPPRPVDREPRRAAVDEYADILSLAGETVTSPSPAAQGIEESRRLPARRLVRHWNSVFSRGVGYETTPAGRAYEGDRVAGYYIDFRAKTVSPSARTPEKLLPAGLAQLALGWWERSLDGEPAAGEEFERACRLLEEQAERRDGELLWPYDFTVRKYPHAWPPYSALAQAQAASAFVRAYVRSGEEHDAELARAAIHSLVHDESPLVALTEHGPVLEESPGEPYSHILNGWIYALWGLRDVALGIGDGDAGRMYDLSLACLRRTIDCYDVGWWTRYSLYPHKLPDLAKPFYHDLHVDQVGILDRLTGFPEFAALERRWRGYRTPENRVRVIAQKAAFVATGYV